MYSGNRVDCPYCVPAVDKFRPTMKIKTSENARYGVNKLNVTAKMVFADGPDRTIKMEDVKTQVPEPSFAVVETVEADNSEGVQAPLTGEESTHDEAESPFDELAVVSPAEEAPVEPSSQEESFDEKPTTEEASAEETPAEPSSESSEEVAEEASEEATEEYQVESAPVDLSAEEESSEEESTVEEPSVEPSSEESSEEVNEESSEEANEYSSEAAPETSIVELFPVELSPTEVSSPELFPVVESPTELSPVETSPTEASFPEAPVETIPAEEISDEKLSQSSLEASEPEASPETSPEPSPKLKANTESAEIISHTAEEVPEFAKRLMEMNKKRAERQKGHQRPTQSSSLPVKRVVTLKRPTPSRSNTPEPASYRGCSVHGSPNNQGCARKPPVPRVSVTRTNLSRVQSPVQKNEDSNEALGECF